MKKKKFDGKILSIKDAIDILNYIEKDVDFTESTFKDGFILLLFLI